MNKIANIKIVDNVLTMYIYNDLAIVNTDPNSLAVYIDECTNIDKIFCDNWEEHDYVFDFLNSTFTFREVIPEGEAEIITAEHIYEITITSDLVKELDGNIKYIKVFVTTEANANDYVEGLYVDLNILYHAEIAHLTKYCNTCLDDTRMLLIMLITFRRQLLELAIETNHNKDALQSYLDLCRILDVKVKNNKKCNNCNKCLNGVCKL